MIPRSTEALTYLAGRLGSRVVPEIQDPYTAMDTGLVSLLLTMLATELESGMSRRLEDGRALKALFGSALEAHPTVPNAGALSGFAASEPAALTLSAVDAWLSEGLALLIDLHAWAEAEDPALNQRIWDFLAAFTDRHRFDV